MKVSDLEKLKRDNAIWGYEVLAENSNGEVSEVKLLLPTNMNRSWYAELLGSAYDRLTRAKTGSLGNLSKGRDGRVDTR